MESVCSGCFTGVGTGVGPFQHGFSLSELPPESEVEPSSTKSSEKFGWKSLFHRRGHSIASHRTEADVDGVLATDNPEQVETQKQLKEIMEKGIKL